MNTSDSRSQQWRNDNRPNLLRHIFQLSVCLALTVPTNAKLLAQYHGFFTDIRPVSGLEGLSGLINEVSDNGLSLSFTWFNRGYYGLYEATRESIYEPFGEPTRVEALNLNGEENAGYTLSSDGLTTYFGSGRPGGGNPSVWTSVRESREGDWGAPQAVELGNNPLFPSLSSDDLALYYNADHRGKRVLFKADRGSVSEPFGDGEPISELHSSRVRFAPTVSSDELAILFGEVAGHGQVRTMISTRSSKNEPFGEPVNIDDFGLGSELNSVSSYLGAPFLSPNWPEDGSKVYFMRNPDGFTPYEATWSVARAPEVMSLAVGETYSQDFDVLGADGASGTALPTAWTVTDRDGVPRQTETNLSFPTSGRALRDSYESTFAINAGQPEGEEAGDRSLAIYKAESPSRPAIQLLADTNGQADALKIDFSLEAWDRIRSTRHNRDGGEAMFDVSVEIATGENTSEMSEFLGGEFTELLSLGTVTTGAVLPKPDGDFLDGNDPAHRISFASDVLQADIPAGSRLRFRWETPRRGAHQEWIFGIDDVNITLAAAGDTDLNGEVDFADFLALSDNFGQAGGWEQGDFDGNGQVEFPDFLKLSANFGGGANAAVAAVPEPTSACLSLFGILGLIGFRKRR